MQLCMIYPHDFRSLGLRELKIVPQLTSNWRQLLTQWVQGMKICLKDLGGVGGWGGFELSLILLIS